MFLKELYRVPTAVYRDVNDMWEELYPLLTIETSWDMFLDMSGITTAAKRKLNSNGGINVYLTLYWKRIAFPFGLTYAATVAYGYICAKSQEGDLFTLVMQTAKTTVRFCKGTLNHHCTMDEVSYSSKSGYIPAVTSCNKEKELLWWLREEHDMIEIDIVDFIMRVRAMDGRNRGTDSKRYTKAIRHLESTLLPILWEYYSKIDTWETFSEGRLGLYNIAVHDVKRFRKQYNTIRNRDKWHATKL